MLEQPNSEDWSVPSDLLAGLTDMADLTITVEKGTNRFMFEVGAGLAQAMAEDTAAHGRGEYTAFDRALNAISNGGTIVLPSLTVRIVVADDDEALLDDEPAFEDRLLGPMPDRVELDGPPF